MAAPSVSDPLRRRHRQKLRISFENKVFLTALYAGVFSILVMLMLLARSALSTEIRWLVGGFAVCAWLAFAWSVREQVLHPLQTLSSLIGALREGDFSMRAHAASRPGSLGEVMHELNQLSEQLRQQRYLSREASALLEKVITEVDVAILAFDGDQRLRLVNRTGERLLGNNKERLLARTAQELGLRDCLEGERARVLQKTFPTGAIHWMRRSTFREDGLPHQLLVISDLGQALREEERRAWQKLVRVMGHEINNSLAPIHSLAGTLEQLLKQRDHSEEWNRDMERGLQVISGRAESLGRFMRQYSRLARLPEPRLARVDLAPLVARVARLDGRLEVDSIQGPELVLFADVDQVEQILVNVLRNAVDAALLTSGKVKVWWNKLAAYAEIVVQDTGPGLADTANLFVPFFTTKPAGSGIGLVLSRQMAEAHGGSLTLQNRVDGAGCEARIRLPLAPSED